MRTVLVALLLALARLAGADDSTTAELTALTPRVLAAIEKQDVAALDAVATWPLRNANLWFDKPECQKRYSGAQTIAKTNAAGLLKCLADLGKPIDGDAGLAIQVYEPGFSILFRSSDGKLTGFLGQDSEPDTPLVMATYFEKHLDSRKFTVDPDAATKAAIVKANDYTGIKFRACATPDGKLVVTMLEKLGRDYPRYVAAFTTASAKWKAVPFVVRGKAVRVCTDATVAYPARPKQLPPPPRE